MVVPFVSPSQEQALAKIKSELTRIGYEGELLQPSYRFQDSFLPGKHERETPLAAFGRTPLDYRTACLAVLLSNGTGEQGKQLVLGFRALGAPLALELRPDGVRLWVVGKTEETTRQLAEFRPSEIAKEIRNREADWSADAILRAKNIDSVRPVRQRDFFDLGLIPALEEHIRQKLDPLLSDSLTAAVQSYRKTEGRKPDERELFRLAFWLLAGKVFYDRRMPQFSTLGEDPGVDTVLRAVANHYSEDVPEILNPPARTAAYKHIWSGMDFRNLSVEVLTHTWANSFVDKKLRRKYGIHSTPRSVAKYIVDRLPFDAFEDTRNLIKHGPLVVEPCCGSGTFLLAALERLREMWPRGLSPETRHEYFKRVLIGFEREAFGVEIARLCLTLADFPNPDHWQLHEENVYEPKRLPNALKRARVVLCNPPFEDLPDSDRGLYTTTFVQQPAEILRRVLADLHPEGVLGFVFPRVILDGVSYREARQELARRFGSIEVVTLPDRVFGTSGHETVLLLATKPQGGASKCKVNHRKVVEGDRRTFELFHEVTSEDSAEKTVAEAGVTLAVPSLRRVWAYLKDMQSLEDVAVAHRGIEWNLKLTKDGKETGNREKLVKDRPQDGFREGIPPRAKPFFAFQCPPTKFLSVKPEDQLYEAYKLPWDRPKVFLNAKTKSRGPFRIAACADTRGLVCYQTFTAIWPNDPSFTVALAAILNGPVANAYVATHEGKLDITSETLDAIPIPKFGKAEIKELEGLVKLYNHAVTDASSMRAIDWSEADRALRRIDAFVLTRYELSPRLERELLDCFRGSVRQVPFEFGPYFPTDFKPYFHLSEYLSAEFSRSTAGELLARQTPAPQDVLDALQAAIEAHAE